MADNAIALQVQTPDSFKTIGNVLNMATTAQHLQAGRQAIGLQNIELQKAQQANQERLGLQQFMSNPDNFQTNGNIDLDKINKAVPAIAPMTGSKVIEHLTTLAQSQTTANQAKLNFTGSERNILAGLYGVMGRAGIDDPKAVMAEMDHLKTLYPDNPNLHQYIDAAKVGLQNIPPGKGAVNKSLITTSQSLLSPPEQQSALTPTAGLVNVGGGQNVAVSTPAVGGNQPNISVNQSPAVTNTLAPGVILDINGQPHYVGGAAQGTKGITGPAPWPTKPGLEAQSAGAGDMTNHFAGLNTSAQSLPIATALTKTIEGLAPNAYVGVGGDKKQFMSGLLGAFGIHPTGDSQTDTNLLHKAMAQLNMSTPAGTDAARTLIEAGQPNTKMDANAIKEAAGTVLGQVRMNAAERNFLQTQRYSNGGAGDTQRYQEGRQQFEANADPRIWQYEDLVKNNPKAARDFITRQPDKADLVRKTKALQSMGFFQ